MFWHTYATQVTAEEDRISLKDFVRKYDFKPEEIEEIDVKGFLDYFEATAEDLYMKTKEEALFLLRGYMLDRKDTKSASGYSGAKCVSFSLEFPVKKKYKGVINFTDNSLYYYSLGDDLEEKIYSFSESDKRILIQALNDRVLMENEVCMPDMLKQVLCIMFHQK